MLASMANPTGPSIWFLRTSGLFQGQGTSLYEELDNSEFEAKFRRGEELPTSLNGEEVIHLIVDGHVKVSPPTEEGNESLVEMLGPGDVVGGIVRGNAGAIGMRARAVGSLITLQLPRSRFDAIIAARPTILVNMISVLEESRHRLELRLSRLLFRSGIGKVAGLLLELGERYGSRNGTTITIDIGVTHHDIASMAGIRRESVSLAMADLELRELIRARRGLITILNPEGLDAVR